MSDNNQTPEFGPDGYRMLTWQDRLLQVVASVLSVSPTLSLNINEVVMGWLREISQGREVTAIEFAEGPGERYIFPAVADPNNKNLAPLTPGKKGKTARASGVLGFTTDSLPLLAEGTVHLAIRPHQLPDGKMCLAADIKEPKLARNNKKENVVTRSLKAKRKAAREAKKQQTKPNTSSTQSAPPNSADTQSAPPTTNSAQSAPSHQTGTDPKPQ